MCPKYRVSISSFDDEIEARDESNAREIARENLYIHVQFIDEEKIKREKREREEKAKSLRVELKDDVKILTDQEHLMLFTATVPKYFDIINRCAPVKFPGIFWMFHVANLADEITFNARDVKINDTYYRVSLLKRFFNYFVPGLDGSETIEVLGTKNSPLFFHINDEWALVAPLGE